MAPSPRPLARFPVDDAGVAPVLASIEDGRAVLDRDDAQRVVDLLGSERKALRRSAAGALATALKSGSLEADVVGVLLADSDAAVRWGAAFALHRAGVSGPSVLEAAFEALASDDGDVRWAASSMLIAVAKRDAGLVDRLRHLALGGRAIERKMALLSLAEAGFGDDATACRALRDEDALVRIAAITVLGRTAELSGCARDALASSAAGDSDGAVRRAAAAVLQRLQRPSMSRRSP